MSGVTEVVDGGRGHEDRPDRAGGGPAPGPCPAQREPSGEATRAGEVPCAVASPTAWRGDRPDELDDRDLDGAVAGRRTDRRGPADPQWHWLPAPAFRSHVRQLAATTGTPWPVLAVLARVSVSAMRTLMAGRDGRPARRIHPWTARRLYLMTAADVCRARRSLVPPGPTRRLLRALDQGTDLDALALRLGIPPATFRAIRDGEPAYCSELVAASAEAAYRLADLQQVRPHSAGRPAVGSTRTAA